MPPLMVIVARQRRLLKEACRWRNRLPCRVRRTLTISDGCGRTYQQLQALRSHRALRDLVCVVMERAQHNIYVRCCPIEYCQDALSSLHLFPVARKGESWSCLQTLSLFRMASPLLGDESTGNNRGRGSDAGAEVFGQVSWGSMEPGRGWAEGAYHVAFGEEEPAFSPDLSPDHSS